MIGIIRNQKSGFLIPQDKKRDRICWLLLRTFLERVQLPQRQGSGTVEYIKDLELDHPAWYTGASVCA